MMSKARKAGRSRSPSTLRDRPKAVLQVAPRHVRPMVQDEVGRPVDELRACRIELEVQNKELRRTQQKLAQSLDYHRLLFEANPNPMYVFAEDSLRLLAVNDAMIRQYGWSREELLDKTAMDLRPPEEVPRLLAALRRRRGRRASFAGEWRHQRKDGSRFEVEVTVSRIDYDGQAARLVLLNDVTARKRAEAALRRSEQEYRSLYENNLSGVFRVDARGRFLEANPAAAKLSGFSVEELRERTFMDLCVPECLEATMAAFRDGLAGKPHDLVTAMSRKDGRRVDLLLSGAPVVIDDRITGLFCVAQDITERKKAELALCQSEMRLQHANRELEQHRAQLQTVLDNLTEGLIICDLDGQMIHWNPAAVELHGFRSENQWRRRLADFPEVFESADREGRVLPIEQWPLSRVLRGETVRDCELHLRRRDQNWRRVFSYSGSLARQKESRASVAVITITDITERKRAEEALARLNATLEQQVAERTQALRESEANFRSYFENVAIGAAQINAQGRFIRVNDRYCAITGYSRAELLGGMGPLDLDHPDDREADREGIAQLFKGDAYELEKRYLARDGRVVWVHVTISAILDATGQFLRSAAVIEDITQRKRAEAALQSHRQLLETVVNHIPASVALLRGSDQRSQLVNPAYQAIAPGKKMLGKTLDELWPETGHDFSRICRRVLKTGESHHVVDELNQIRRRSNGPLETAYFSWSLHRVRLPGAERWGLLNTAWETTTRKQAEIALAESEQHLRAILDTAAEGIVTLDARGRIESMNPAALKLFGYATEEIVSQSINRLLTLPAKAPLDDFLVYHRERGLKNRLMGHPLEVVGRSKSGTMMILELSLTPLAHATRAGFVAMVHDITERRRLERELLEVGERERRQMGHELHDDLGQILHGAQFLVTSLQARLERKGVAEAAQLGRVSQYLEEALDTTRSLARGLQPVPPVPEGLMNALSEHAGRIRKLYGVSCRFSCGKPVIVADATVATHLFRIAQEAVNNAVKHSKCKRIVIRLRAANGRLVLGIRDDGHGRFPAPARQRGMGLHVMEFRAAAIGGSLVVQRQPGRGTDVVCTVTPFPNDNPARRTPRTRKTTR